MSNQLKHPKAKLPRSQAYQEQKVAKKNLKRYQTSIQATQAEEKSQTRLENIAHNARIKQFAFRF